MNQRTAVSVVGDASADFSAAGGAASIKKRRTHILVEFPDSRLECVVVQWDLYRPSVLIQLARNAAEPVQFPGKRADIPGNDLLPKDQPSALDAALLDFIDPLSGRVFGLEPYLADLLFSHRAFALLQPEPDLVLPLAALWEIRTEALQSLGIPDLEGTRMGSELLG
jgi:hypothetical protein